jgi:hypothetical protein
VRDDALAGADSAKTAAVLAAVIRPLSADLVFAGNESTDGRGGVVPSMIAEHLAGWAEEWVLWSTQEFSFLALPDNICTGSSSLACDLLIFGGNKHVVDKRALSRHLYRSFQQRFTANLS